MITVDDCVSSIGDFTSNINITNINCGPGHGISFGSLGRDGTEAKVDTINVSHVNFFGSTNGARIKTWQNIFATFLILCMVTTGMSISTNLLILPSLNVLDYGAVGDGKTDDSQAFLKAWKAACEAPLNIPIVIIPAMKTFLLKPVIFGGPCKPSRIYVQVSGNIIAPNRKLAWSEYQNNTWLGFANVTGLIISGAGTIDGKGAVWWPQPCLINETNGVTCRIPSALTFSGCNLLELNGLRHINSPRNHITITNCKGATISNLRIIAPPTSPNTDGIDISRSSHIHIHNCIIATGDDCIAITGGSTNINVNGVTCGPGHGISIGALGAEGKNEIVEQIHVQNCTLKGTTNGIRIKTWQGGIGYARKISFEKIKLIAVDNPIVIDQFYCPNQVSCQNQTSAVKVSDVSYKLIYGTSTTDKVIDLSCSQSVGCTNIVLDHVYITSTVPGKKAYSYCFNAHGASTHTKPAMKCLLR